MNKYLKWTFRIVLILVALSGLAFCGSMVYFFAGTPSCNEDSEAVSYARSLSKERLAELYRDMERYSTLDEEIAPFGYTVTDAGSNIPEVFADLRVRKIRPRDGNIMVEGCFDHYVFLRFSGIGHLKEIHKERKITLSWGEFPPNSGSEVLWSE